MRKFGFLFLLSLVFLVLLVLASAAPESCIKPTNGMVITNNTVFCKGIYNLTDGIVINASNVVLNCNGSILNGTYEYESRGIEILGNDSTIKNCNITQFYYGIYVMSSHRNSIENNNIYLNGYGASIRFDYAHNNTIKNSRIFSNYEGIRIYNSHNSLILNNTIYNNLLGIQFYDSNYNYLENNRIHTNYYFGLELRDGNIVKNNSIYGNGEDGIKFYGMFNKLTNNSINNHTFAIKLDYNYLINDIDTSNTVDGKPVYYLLSKRNLKVPQNAFFVGLVNCTNITISNLEVKNQSQGVVIYKTTNSTIKDVNISSNRNNGIYMYESNNNKMEGCIIHLNTYHGIEVSDSEENTIKNCKIYSNEGNGINLIGWSNGNKLYNNEIYRNRDNGLYLNGVSNNLTNNKIYLNTNNGLVVGGWGVNFFRNNSMYLNNKNLVVYSTDPHDLDPSNTVENKPVYYLVNQSNRKVPLDAGYVALIECDNITVSNLELKNTYHGLMIYKTTNSTIKNLTIFDNNYGLYISNSNGNYIINNNIHSNTFGGVYIDYSWDNLIERNTIKENGWYGIELYNIPSEYMNLFNNSITYNNIMDNNVYNLNEAIGYDFSIENNWWGSTDKDIIEDWISYAESVDYEPYLYGPFDTNWLPVVEDLECYNSTSWAECDDLKYNKPLTKVRVKCNDIDGEVNTVKFELKDLFDYQPIFNGVAIFGSGYWVYDNTDLLLGYKGLILSAICTDNESGEKRETVSWLLKKGEPRSITFYEGFDSVSSIMEKNGTLDNNPRIVEGIIGNGVDFRFNKKGCYPIPGNINETNGTIEFWVKAPMKDHIGFFDIGYLGAPNSWGIFKNVGYAIMEVKNNVNTFNQAWSPNPYSYKGAWQFIAGVWEKKYDTTYFKICLDGECKQSYDGSTSDSYPNMSKNFCLGWCGWYGYSDSIMDEVKIFNYAKPDDEIKHDYLTMENFTKQNLSKKECKMYKPESKGEVKINCSGLFVDNKPFTAKGVGYQPIPIGKTATSLQHKQEMYDDIKIRKRDFPLLRKMNANTIRTWGEVMNKTWLDDLYNNGTNPVYVLMGFWINCNENWGDPTIRQGYINNFADYVNKYKDHPAVLAWGLGNENNLGFCSNPSYLDDFYSLCNELARVAYEIEGENYHPVGIVNGDLGYIGLNELNSDDDSLGYIDFWGDNVYPGKTFGDWFDRYASLSGKPLFITEYGIDALNNSNYEEYEDVHAEWVLSQWSDINNAKVTIGSTLMAYSDEWWKCGNYWGQDYCGYQTSRHPDGYGNEEWWGVMRTVKNTSGVIDIMEPRKVYYALQYAWGEKATINISLKKGWNLISIPLAPPNISVSSIFNKSIPIYAYNGSWFVPKEIDNKLGYWVKANQSVNITIFGTKANDNIELNRGWNLVGYPYLEEKNVSEIFKGVNIKSVFAYNASWSSYITNRSFNSLENMKPGYGYWVKAG